MELLKPDNLEYRRCEELILKRDMIMKEAATIQIRYIREFGALMLESFRTKSDCLKYKKRMAYCQMMIGHGKVIKQKDMQRFVERETVGFDNQYLMISHDFARANNTELATEAVQLEAGQLYRKIALRIHPEINSRTMIIPGLTDLWNEVMAAFHENSVGDLIRLDAMADEELDKLGPYLEVYIPNMKEKIIRLEEEIDAVISTDPYRYRDILANPALVREKRETLEREIRDYREYQEDLEKKFEAIFMHRKIRFMWERV